MSTWWSIARTGKLEQSAPHEGDTGMFSQTEFDSILRNVRPQLLRYIERLVGSADADDVVQVVLSKAFSALPEFRGESSPRTWLFRIATHAAYDWRRARRPQQSSEEPDGDVEGTELEQTAGQERQLLREEMSRCVHEVLQRLPENYQTVLALSDCEELSDREVAEVLGVTVGSAKIRLHRARVQLKAELERTCSFYRDAENTLCCDRKEISSEGSNPTSARTCCEAGASCGTSGSEMRSSVDSGGPKGCCGKSQ